MLRYAILALVLAMTAGPALACGAAGMDATSAPVQTPTDGTAADPATAPADPAPKTP